MTEPQEELPAVPPAEPTQDFEGLRGSEIVPFDDPHEAADWMLTVIPELEDVGDPAGRKRNGIDAWPDGVSSETAQAMAAAGITIEYSQDNTYFPSVGYEVNLHDEAGADYRLKVDHVYDPGDGHKRVDDIDISYATATAESGDRYTQGVMYDGHMAVQRQYNGDQPLSYVLRRNAVTEMDDVSFDPADGTKFKFAETPEDIHDAEAAFLKLAAGFRAALESKMASIDPVKMDKLTAAHEASQQGIIRRTLGKLSFWN